MTPSTSGSRRASTCTASLKTMPLALNSEMRSALWDDDRRDTEAQRRGFDDFIRDGNTHTVAHVAKAIWFER